MKDLVFWKHAESLYVLYNTSMYITNYVQVSPLRNLQMYICYILKRGSTCKCIEKVKVLALGILHGYIRARQGDTIDISRAGVGLSGRWLNGNINYGVT